MVKKQVIVISLGGSQIIHNNEINIPFLKNFKKILLKHSKNHKFVVVCGGGSIARIYIQGLQKVNANEKLQNFAGISVTRTNARFMNYFFNQDAEQGIPHKIKQVKKSIKKQDIIFCGALEYHPNQTSDSTSAQIAQIFNAEFINLTDTKGLHNKNPKTNKNAKFIPTITWKEFYKIASKLGFKPGQHFVLDQTAAKIIMEKKIKTYILGQNLQNLDNLLKNKKFTGTTISN